MPTKSYCLNSDAGNLPVCQNGLYFSNVPDTIDSIVNEVEDFEKTLVDYNIDNILE